MQLPSKNILVVRSQCEYGYSNVGSSVQRHWPRILHLREEATDDRTPYIRHCPDGLSLLYSKYLCASRDWCFFSMSTLFYTHIAK